MGSNAIDVSLDIRIQAESLGGIQLTGDRGFTNDNTPSLYLALIDGENEVPIGSDGITMDITVGEAPEGAYEYGYDRERNTYTYQPKDDKGNIDFGSYSFQITGDANGNGDWPRLTDVKPQITVAWKIVSKDSM